MTSDIQADVIERAWRCSETIILRRLYENRIKGYTIDTAQEIAHAVLGAAGWPDLVAERDRLRKAAKEQTTEITRLGDVVAEQEETIHRGVAEQGRQYALIAEMAAGLREARSYGVWGHKASMEAVARIDALLAKAEGTK